MNARAPSSLSRADLQCVCRTLTETSLYPSAVVKGRDHIVLYANPAFCLLTGMAKEQLIGSALRMPGGDDCGLMLDRVYRTGKAETHRRKEGPTERDLNWSCCMSPVPDARVHPVGVFIQVTEASALHEDTLAMNEALLLGSLRQQELTAAAVTLNAQLQREMAFSKQAQEALLTNERHIEGALREKEMLLGEIHHRVKNNLQIVYSLLGLQSSQIQDPAVVAMLLDTQHRIRSMGLIHQTLYQANNFSRVEFGIFLDSLVPTLIESYLDTPDRVKLSIHAENVYLPITMAIPCGLLVNELISNCLKHAFPDGRRGEIRIALRPVNGDAVNLCISDNGVGIPADFNMAETTSLGMQLVFMLSDQLGGEMEVHRSNPTSFGLTFSVTEAAVALDENEHKPKLGSWA